MRNRGAASRGHLPMCTGGSIGTRPRRLIATQIISVLGGHAKLNSKTSVVKTMMSAQPIQTQPSIIRPLFVSSVFHRLGHVRYLLLLYAIGNVRAPHLCAVGPCRLCMQSSHRTKTFAQIKLCGPPKTSPPTVDCQKPNTMVSGDQWVQQQYKSN